MGPDAVVALRHIEGQTFSAGRDVAVGSEEDDGHEDQWYDDDERLGA